VSPSFMEDAATGERYAVYVSVFSFRRLPDPISGQWLGKLCPGAPLPFDVEVRDRSVLQRAQPAAFSRAIIAEPRRNQTSTAGSLLVSP
jgi:hypothetical protein